MINRILNRKRILSERAAELKERERALFERLRNGLALFGSDVTQDDARRLDEAVRQLNELFLIVVAGEFNSGKSSFINALLGENILPEGVTPTTDRIHVLTYGESPSTQDVEEYIQIRRWPSPILQELNIVDTPGTNAVIRRHEELTRDYIPRSDLVLFITSADRPYTESERTFLEHIRKWGKKVVFILNKVDILKPEDIPEVVRFIQVHSSALLERTPEVFPLSAREAGRGSERDVERWKRSGFEVLERYLLETLDQEERIRLKLLNPLGVALHLADAYAEISGRRLEALRSDIDAIDNIDRQKALYRTETLEGLAVPFQRISALMKELEARGNAFFDAHIQLSRIRELFDPDELQRQFEYEVLSPFDRQVGIEIDRITDWLIERHLKLWQDVNAYLDRRRISRHKDDLIGDVGQTFQYNRQDVLEGIQRRAEDALRSYNREAEAGRLAAELRSALTTTALTEAGAVGLGAALVALLTGAVADISGILLATAVAVGGFYVIPSKRRKVKRAFAEQVRELESRLLENLRTQIETEVDTALGRIGEAVSPYTRFVGLQRDQFAKARDELEAVASELKRLRREIGEEK